MKRSLWRVINHLTGALLFVALIACGANTQADAVQIPDAALSNAVYQALGKTSGEITAADMLGLSSLNASWQGVRDTTGLETAHNLASLTLDGNGLTNLDGFAGLTNLGALSLRWCYLGDFTFLNPLGGVTNLDVTGNSMTNAAPLAQLTQLGWLLAGNNQIQDLSPLAGLTNLVWLGLTWNQLTNLGPLAPMTGLLNLDLSGNGGVTDLTPLAGLSQLQWLRCGGTAATNLSVIANLSQLSELELGSCGLTNVDFLAGLTNLGSLWLQRNQLATLPPMASSNVLWLLCLDENSLGDLGFLARFPTLQDLYLSNMKGMSNFTALSQLSQLGTLELNQDQLPGLDVLPVLPNLSNLSVQNNDLEDASPLAAFPNLSGVGLSGNLLTSIHSLTHLPLGGLNVSYNRIDFSPGTEAFDDLQFLQGKGVWVYYDPQILLPFSVASQPVSQSVVAGGDAVFSLTVTGDVSNLGCQWQFEGADLDGQTSTSLRLMGVRPALAGAYRARLTDTSTGYYVYSSKAFLSVLTNFSIVSPPADLAVHLGEAASLSVSAQGAGPFAYQWLRNGTNLPAAVVIETLAGKGVGDGGLAVEAALYNPGAVAVDFAGNLYIADTQGHRLRKVDTNGIISTIAGTGVAGYSGDGHPAVGASLNNPTGVCVDADGSVYIVDSWNARIRKVDTNGIISTVAGDEDVGGSVDGGLAVNTALYWPQGAALDSRHNLYIADTGSHRIRKVDTNGIITTVAGNGAGDLAGDGGLATSASLNSPRGIILDASGNLFIADSDNHRVRVVNTNGIINTLAGDGTYGTQGDGGPATSAQIGYPAGLTLDGSNNLYVSDDWGQTVRRVDTNGIISTVAGNGDWGSFYGDGGPAVKSTLNGPSGLAWDAAGNLLIADPGSQRIRKVDGAGIITTVAGGWLGDGKGADQAILRRPQGVAIDAHGNVLVADTMQDRVRKVNAWGVISTVAGDGNSGWSSSDEGNLATRVRLANPVGLAAGLSDALFIADTGVYRIRKVDSAGIFTTVAGNGNWGPTADGVPAIDVGLARPRGVIQDQFGNLFISDTDRNCIRKVDAAGIISTVAGTGQWGADGDGGPAVDAMLAGPSGLALDAAGNLFIADTGNHLIRKLATNGLITAVAGNGSGYGHYAGDAGAATAAALNSPAAVAVDAGGNLFIADSDNHRIRRVDTNGIITTVAGNGIAGFSGDGASPLDAELNEPAGVAVDSQGRLFIADRDNDRVRAVGPFQGPTLTINATTDADSGDYSVIVTSPYGSLTSAVATVTVTLPGPLAINAQPTNQTVNLGDPASFQVTAGGAGPFTFQWFKDYSPIPGATHSRYPISQSSAGDAGAYWVVVSNLTDNLESDHVSLTVVIPPSLSIAEQPTNQTVTLGDPALFCVTPGGTDPFTFQWYKDAAPIPGATDSCYPIAQTSAGDGGAYWVVVSNVVGRLESDHVSLTVHLPQPPVFDLNPTNITLLMTDSATVYLSAHATGDLPITYTLMLGNGVTFGYTQTLSQDQNVVFTRYFNQSSVTTSYRIQACNVAGCATSAVATVTVHVPAYVRRDPQSDTVLKGRGLTLSASASGDDPISYQWLKNGSAISGATGPTLPFNAVGYDDTASYSLRVSNTWGAAASAAAAVTVVPCYYTAINLGALGTNQANSEAFGVNNFGEVVGQSDINEWKSYGNRLAHGFVWPAGPGLTYMADLGDGRNCVNNDYTNKLVGYSGAYSINDDFDIVGYYEYRWAPASDGYGHAAYWRQQHCGFTTPPPPGTHCLLDLVDIHPRDIYMYPPDTEAVSINRHRQIVLQAGMVWTLTHYGYLLTPSDPSSRFSPLNARIMGSADAGWIVPAAINDSGLVVGRVDACIGCDQPYRFDGNAYAGFDAMSTPIPRAYTRAFQAVNDLGVIAGYYITNTPEGWARHQFFLLHPNGALDLPPDPFVDVTVKAVNNRNQAVGREYANRGALFTDGHWFLLKDLIMGGGVNVVTANAINDSGQIVGQARFTGAQGSTAYLLTPSAGGPNHPPVAAPDDVRVSAPARLRISPALLLANDSDPDGDSIYLKSVGDDQGRTAMGGTVAYQGGAIIYTPPSGPIAGDSFAYRISDSLGAESSSQVTLTFDPLAPVAPEVINPPQFLADGSILLSGSAPAGSVVLVYYSTDLTASYWTRDTTLVVPASGQWSAIRPGTVGGKKAFYKAEIQ